MQHVGRADPGLYPGEAQRPVRKVPCWASSDEAGVNPTYKTLASANIVQVTIGSTVRTQ